MFEKTKRWCQTFANKYSKNTQHTNPYPGPIPYLGYPEQFCLSFIRRVYHNPSETHLSRPFDRVQLQKHTLFIDSSLFFGPVFLKKSGCPASPPDPRFDEVLRNASCGAAVGSVAAETERRVSTAWRIIPGLV